MIANEKIYYWLTLSGISQVRQQKLIEFYKTPFDLWEAVRSEKRVIEPNIGAKHFEALEYYRKEELLDRDLDSLYQKGISLVCYDDERYPERLKQKEVGSPRLLFCKGDTSLLKTTCVAIVGTRRCTRYGKLMAEKIPKGLAEAGVTVVSGLADGIDTYAHRAVIESGGKTIAVLGSGVNRITPAVNQGFADSLLASGRGLIISEYLPNFSGAKHTFPERNRIISGLSLGVVVVEAGDRSGALITARQAGEQGREAFAIPGNADNPQSNGCNALIKQGAHLVTEAGDILEVLNLQKNETEKPHKLQLDIFEDTVYNELLSGRKHFDELLDRLKVNPQELMTTLSALELKRIVRREPGNMYAINIAN